MLLIPFCVAAAPANPNPAGASPEAPVQVRFPDPEAFTDASFDHRASSRGEVMQELAAYLVARATPLLSPGQRLRIDIVDVDLAGRYEPWTSPGHDIRYLRDTTWPRLRLTYRLEDAQGASVAGATEDLSDMNYRMRAGLRSDPDRLRYEKAMLDDWLRARFGASKAG